MHQILFGVIHCIYVAFNSHFENFSYFNLTGCGITYELGLNLYFKITFFEFDGEIKRKIPEAAIGTKFGQTTYSFTWTQEQINLEIFNDDLKIFH